MHRIDLKARMVNRPPRKTKRDGKIKANWKRSAQVRSDSAMLCSGPDLLEHKLLLWCCSDPSAQVEVWEWPQPPWELLNGGSHLEPCLCSDITKVLFLSGISQFTELALAQTRCINISCLSRPVKSHTWHSRLIHSDPTSRFLSRAATQTYCSSLLGISIPLLDRVRMLFKNKYKQDALALKE